MPFTTHNWFGWQRKFCPRTSALKSLACWSDTGAVYSHNRHGVASKQRDDISVITLAEGTTPRAPEHHIKWQSVSYTVTHWNQPLPGLHELAMTFNSWGRLILEHLNHSSRLNTSACAVQYQLPLKALGSLLPCVFPTLEKQVEEKEVWWDSVLNQHHLLELDEMGLHHYTDLRCI